MRTLDGTENTEGREEGGRGQGRGEKESKVGRKSVYVARERERETGKRGKTRAAMGHRGRRWGGEVDRVTYRCC